MTNSYQIEIVPNSQINLGEGPHWDIETQSLYYVDIYGGSVFRYDYKEKKIYKCQIVGENMVSFITPVHSNNTKDEFVIGVGRRIALIKWDGKATETKIHKILFTVEDDKPDNRFNDAKCDPKGRLFAGTMRLEILEGDIFSFHEGNLYRYSNEKGLVKVKNNVGISNGLDWNTNLKKMYFIDSVDMNVVELDYNEVTGDIDVNNTRELIHFDGKPDIVPDGMCVDSNGLLYITLHGNGKLVIVEPKNGKIVEEIKFPSNLITSCAFGGPNLDILFVTSAHKGKENHPAGSLYIVKGLKAKGVPMNKFRLN